MARSPHTLSNSSEFTCAAAYLSFRHSDAGYRTNRWPAGPLALSWPVLTVTAETDSTGFIELSFSGYAALDSVKWTNLSVICRDGEKREEEGAHGTYTQ